MGRRCFERRGDYFRKGARGGFSGSEMVERVGIRRVRPVFGGCFLSFLLWWAGWCGKRGVVSRFLFDWEG